MQSNAARNMIRRLLYNVIPNVCLCGLPYICENNVSHAVAIPAHTRIPKPQKIELAKATPSRSMCPKCPQKKTAIGAIRSCPACVMTTGHAMFNREQSSVAQDVIFERAAVVSSESAPSGSASTRESIILGLIWIVALLCIS